jgi:aminoglycoside/choline kinase family phosphotransferase
MEQHGPAVREAILTGDTALVHADLHEENILQDGRLLGFIDFGVAFVGVPAWEFAALAYFLDWELADRTLVRYLDTQAGLGAPSDIDEWRRSIALVALSLGARRWEQDRENDLDEDPHNLAFLGTAMERLET